jgi:hypothetical protein
MNIEEILDRLNRLTPFSAAKTSVLFELASDLRPLAHRHMPPEIRELIGAAGEELATRSSGYLKALGLLADVADRPRMERILLGRSHWIAADARCAAALFRLLDRPHSQARAHSLADEAGGDFADLGNEVVSELKRLIVRAGDVEHDHESAWNAPIRENLNWPAEPISIPNLAGVRVRPLRSRQQIDRATHHLQNCLASLYRPAILDGTKRVATVEIDGAPVECLEIDRRSGRVLSWKGARNNPPDEIRRRVIEKHLVASNIVAGRLG